MATIFFFLVTICILSAMIYCQVRRSFDEWRQEQTENRRASSAAHRETQLHWFYDDILSHKQS